MKLESIEKPPVLNMCDQKSATQAENNGWVFTKRLVNQTSRLMSSTALAFLLTHSPIHSQDEPASGNDDLIEIETTSAPPPELDIQEEIEDPASGHQPMPSSGGTINPFPAPTNSRLELVTPAKSESKR